MITYDAWFVGFLFNIMEVGDGAQVKGTKSDTKHFDPNFKPTDAIFGTKSSLWWVELETSKIWPATNIYDNGWKDPTDRCNYWRGHSEVTDPKIKSGLLSMFRGAM